MRTAKAGYWITVMLLQQAVSAAFFFGALLFPWYVLYRHGSSILPIYDRTGNVIGHANYFFVSLGFSAFTLIISAYCFILARKAARQLRGNK